MPLELVAERPGQAVLREYDEQALAPDQVRLKSLYSAVKHGTELRAFRADSADSTDRWDRELRMHRRGEPLTGAFPLSLGNMCLGVVTEVGQKVDSMTIGDHAFAHLPIRETHNVIVSSLNKAPDGANWKSIMYWDPTDYALGAVRDAPVRFGDRVAVFGLGAIGLMMAQMARLAGARWVAVIDPIQRRRDAALRHGADAGFDPASVDAGLELKLATEKSGVDVAFETSGSYRAFEDAIRATCYAGTLVSTANYHGERGVYLDGEWHRNRINVISSRAVSQPLPQPGWDVARIRRESLALVVEGRLQTDGLIDPIVPLSQAAEAYHEINEHPERSIKLGIDHSLDQG